MNSKVADFDIDFMSLLGAAQLNAATLWEMDFVASLVERYKYHDRDTHVSPRELECLYRVARWQQ